MRTFSRESSYLPLLFYASPAHIHLEAPNWHQLSDLFVSLFLESILFVALKKRIPSKFAIFFLMFCLIKKRSVETFVCF